MISGLVLAHLNRRLKGELKVYQCSVVRRRQPFSNVIISEVSMPIAIKFHLKHHWGEGKAARGSGADQFRTLVSLATDSSHRVILEKRRHHVFMNVFIGSFSYLQVMMKCMRTWMSSKFGRIRRTTEVAALKRLKKFP